MRTWYLIGRKVAADPGEVRGRTPHGRGLTAKRYPGAATCVTLRPWNQALS